MNTTKLYLASALATAVMILATASASASTFGLSPANFNVKAGQNFSLNVSFNPEGVKNYTVKMGLNFPSDIVRVTTFIPGKSWVAVGATGYDSVDNTTGMLIKTNGFPAGVTDNVEFGTVYFTAIKAGTGSIIVNNDVSVAMDSNNANTLHGVAPQASVTVTPAPVVPATTTTNSGTVSSTGTTGTEETTITPTGTENTTTTPETSTTPTAPNPGQASLLSAVMNVLSFGTGQIWLAILVILIILGAIWYGYNYYTKRGVQTK